MVLGVIALTGLAGLIAALWTRGPAKALGGALATGALATLVLALLIGPVAVFVAIAALGAILAFFPPTAPESHTARRWWLIALALAEAALICWFAAKKPDMTALWCMLFAPGAVVAAIRLATGRPQGATHPSA